MSDQENKKRVLIISGGGARGAWGGGLIKALYEKEKPDYRCIVGNSTGSLLAPMVALNAYDKMEQGFTDVNQKTVFNINPFKQNGKVNPWIAALRILLGKKTLGETQNLRKRIFSFFTEKDLEDIKASGREVKVAIVNLTTNTLLFKSTQDCDYAEMVDWIWASANTPVFMSDLSKYEELWVDGGIKENVPIVEGLEFAKANDIKTIDVVVNYHKGERNICWPEKGKKANIISKLLRIIHIFSDEVRISDIENGLCRAKANDKIINLYYMEEEEYLLCPENLLFKKPILKELWKCGYNHPLAKLFISSIPLPGNNEIRLR